MPYAEVEHLGRNGTFRTPDGSSAACGRCGDGSGHYLLHLGYHRAPQGTLLTHRNILSMVASLNEVDPKAPSDQFLSFIPLPWIVEQTMSVFSALYTGYNRQLPGRAGVLHGRSLRDCTEPDCGLSADVGGDLPAVMVKHLDASRTKRWLRAVLPIGYALGRLQVRQAEAAADVEDSLWAGLCGRLPRSAGPHGIFAGAHGHDRRAALGRRFRSFTPWASI